MNNLIKSAFTGHKINKHISAETVRDHSALVDVPYPPFVGVVSIAAYLRN